MHLDFLMINIIVIILIYILPYPKRFTVAYHNRKTTQAEEVTVDSQTTPKSENSTPIYIHTPLLSLLHVKEQKFHMAILDKIPSFNHPVTFSYG